MNSNSFEELGLSAPVVRVLEKLGITEPTEIQTKALPHGLAGRDVLASAETGSGKTAAFLLPIIERLQKPSKGTKPRALVLAPTRELALQIEANAKSYSAACKLRSVALVGGESVTKQLNALSRGADIIIATPGRLNDFILRRVVSFDLIEVFVLDEADRMLDMGFLPQVRRIMNHLPRKRQTMLLSATLSRAVEQLAREMTTSPIRVEARRYGCDANSERLLGAFACEGPAAAPVARARCCRFVPGVHRDETRSGSGRPNVNRKPAQRGDDSL